MVHTPHGIYSTLGDDGDEQYIWLGAEVNVMAPVLINATIIRSLRSHGLINVIFICLYSMEQYFRSLVLKN